MTIYFKENSLYKLIYKIFIFQLWISSRASYWKKNSVMSLNLFQISGDVLSKNCGTQIQRRAYDNDNVELRSF